MTDLISRLRLAPNEKTKGAMQRDGLAAADEIERLRAALNDIILVMGPKAPPCCDGCAFEWNEALTTARAALKEPT